MVPHQNLKCFTTCLYLFCCCNHFGALNLTNHLHGTESSAWCLLGYLRYSPHGTEIEVSQTPLLISVLSHAKLIPTSHPISTQFCPSTYAYAYTVISFFQVFPPYPCISFLSHACHVPQPSHPPQLDLYNV